MTAPLQQVNLHLYPSPMTHESRILKETDAVSSFAVFDRIILVGTMGAGLPDTVSIGKRREVYRFSRSAPAWLPAVMGKVLGVTGWSLRVFRRFALEPITCINCHSLSVLPLSVALKWRTGARLVYDTHELETETNGLGGIRKTVAKLVERLLFPSVDETIVVGDGIADWYAATYGRRRPAVVLNCPQRRDAKKSDKLREVLRLPADTTIFLYQGILGKGRGIELLLDAFSGLKDPRKVLVFMGMGPLESLVAAKSRECSGIRLHPAVAPQVLAEYTASADVGLCLIEDTCLSYRYCMPNKLFEYFAAGVPAVVSDLPEIAGVVSRTGSGWVVADWSAAALCSVMESIDAPAIAARRAAAASAAVEYCWERQVPVLREVYARLGLVAARAA